MTVFDCHATSCCYSTCRYNSCGIAVAIGSCTCALYRTCIVAISDYSIGSTHTCDDTTCRAHRSDRTSIVRLGYFGINSCTTDNSSYLIVSLSSRNFSWICTTSHFDQVISCCSRYWTDHTSNRWFAAANYIRFIGTICNGRSIVSITHYDSYNPTDTTGCPFNSRCIRAIGNFAFLGEITDNSSEIDFSIRSCSRTDASLITCCVARDNFTRTVTGNRTNFGFGLDNNILDTYITYDTFCTDRSEQTAISIGTFIQRPVLYLILFGRTSCTGIDNISLSCFVYSGEITVISVIDQFCTDRCHIYACKVNIYSLFVVLIKILADVPQMTGLRDNIFRSFFSVSTGLVKQIVCLYNFTSHLSYSSSANVCVRE